MNGKNWFHGARRFLFYFLTLLGPNIVALFYSVPPVKVFGVSIMKFFGVYQLLQPFAILLVIILVIGIPIVVSFFEAAIVGGEKDRQIQILTNLITHIDTVVCAKHSRFSDVLKRVHQLTGVSTFKELTQPRSQIVKIIENVAAYFEVVQGDETVKASLLRCKAGKVDSFYIYLEGDPKTEIADLNKRTSAASTCIKTKKIVVVADTDAPGSTFEKGNHTPTKTKSIICYPVFKGNEIEFVLSITSRKRGAFRHRDKDIFDFVLEQFSKRIVLEFYLHCIKEAVDGKAEA